MSECRFGRTPDGMLAVYVRRCPKYRPWILGSRVAAAERGWQIVAKEVMPDYARLLVRVGPMDALAQVVRRGLPHHRMRSTVAWSPSYFATSAGYVSVSAVRPDSEQRRDAVAS